MADTKSYSCRKSLSSCQSFSLISWVQLSEYATIDAKIEPVPSERLGDLIGASRLLKNL
jgi:hypothetical protein